MSRRPPPLPPGSPGAKRVEAAPPTMPSGADRRHRQDAEDTATSLLVRPSVRSPASIDLAEVTHPDPVDSIDLGPEPGPGEPIESSPEPDHEVDPEPERDDERVAATLVEPESPLGSLARPGPVASFDDIETTQITVDLPELPPVASSGAHRHRAAAVGPPAASGSSGAGHSWGGDRPAGEAGAEGDSARSGPPLLARRTPHREQRRPRPRHRRLPPGLRDRRQQRRRARSARAPLRRGGRLGSERRLPRPARGAGDESSRRVARAHGGR